jgi:hypothetical protein
LADASTRQLGIPEFLYRNTDEDEEESDTNNPTHNEGADDISPSLEVGKPENSIVHHEQTELRPDQVEYIEDLSDDEKFGHQNNVTKWYFVCVKTHTTL